MSKTIQEQIEVMQHFANGAKIEALNKDTFKTSIWFEAPEPVWNWKIYDYRIKEQKKTVTIEKWLHEDGRCIEIEKGKLKFGVGSIIIGSYETEL